MVSFILFYLINFSLHNGTFLQLYYMNKFFSIFPLFDLKSVQANQYPTPLARNDDALRAWVTYPTLERVGRVATRIFFCMV